MPQKYVRVDGVATFLQHVGPTTLPERPPALGRGETVVCLHGAAGNSGVFADLLARLEPAHSPLAFDRPGHARSGGLDSLESVARMSEFMLGFCDALGIASCVLLGASLGGAIALETALAAPARVRALVLIGAAARADVDEARIEKLRRVAEGKARREFERDAFSAHATPDVMRRGFMESLKTDPRVVHGNALALRGFDRSRDLGRVACPALVVVGEDDAPGRAASDALAAGIRGAKLAVLPKCGHDVALEQPEALATALLGFLAELPR